MKLNGGLVANGSILIAIEMEIVNVANYKYYKND